MVDNNAALANRRRLIKALRSPMPEGFSWDFEYIKKHTSCGSGGCALGLASELWPELDVDDKKNVAEFFGMAGDEITGVFYGKYDAYNYIEIKDITPIMVANALESLENGQK